MCFRQQRLDELGQGSSLVELECDDVILEAAFFVVGQLALTLEVLILFFECFVDPTNGLL